MIGLIYATLATTTVAGLDYTVIPLLTTVAARLGIVEPPPSMEWMDSPQAIAAALGLYVLGLVSARLGRPDQLKVLERAVGVPFAAASLAALGLGAADRSGLEGALVGESSTAGAWLRPGEYTGADAAALSGIAAVSTPISLFGRGLRRLSARVPYAKAVHSGVAIIGMSASAAVSRLPTEAIVAVLSVAAVAAVLFAFGILSRARRLFVWWTSVGQGASRRQRVGVLAELVLPGTGAFIIGRPWSGLPRLAAAIALLVGILFLGPALVPAYIFVGLGGALQVAEEAVTDDASDDDDDGWSIGDDSPEPEPALVTAGAGQAPEEDW